MLEKCSHNIYLLAGIPEMKMNTCELNYCIKPCMCYACYIKDRKTDFFFL